jgi:DNA-binding SARP family transcriptional activator
VGLPAGRARTVLALLCASPGQVVSRDRLIDEAWNGAPPGTAVTQVHGFISALRRVLGPAVIQTSGNGYLLTAGETDLDRMRALILRARALREEGSRETAAGCLREALALWRGRPFEDIGCNSLETSADLIESERAIAIEEYAENELALGNAAELAGPLAAWASEYPLRERLRASLIQALLLTGRQADAISAYHELRQMLSDELGVDPGPVLRGLYERILTGDRALMASGGAGTPAPAQIPAAVADFTGRVVQVNELLTTLSRGMPAAVVISAVSGIGGVGKSALAVHVAHLMRAEFPDGQVFMNLAGTSGEPVSPTDVLARLLRDFGVAPGDVPTGFDERSARYRSVLADRRVLLVLDDACDAAQVRPLLPGSPTCAVLVTSRAMLPDLAGAVHLGLPVMAPDEGAELFAKIVGSRRAAAEPGAVMEIMRACAGLPLAIRIAAVKLTARPGWSIAEMAGRLAAEHRRLAELTSGDLAVRASFRLSYDGLSPAAADAFRLLGLLPVGEFALPAAAALLELPPVEAEQVLDELIDANLLDAPAPGVCKLHDLLRLFASEMVTAELAPTDRGAAIGRLVRWYAAALQAAVAELARGRPVPPGRDFPSDGVPVFGSHNAALDWWHREQGNVAWAIRSAAEAGTHDTAARMAALLWMYAERSSSVAWIEPSYLIGLDCARNLGDTAMEVWLLSELGGLLSTRLERDEESIGVLERAMSAYQGLGDKLGEARVHNKLGTANHNLERFEAALEQFELSQAVFDSLGLLNMRAMGLSNAGTACRSMGAWDKALDRYAQALEIRQRIGDRHGEGVSRTNLGVAYRLMGKLSESLEQHRLAVSIQRELGSNHWWLLSALDELGQTLAALGHHDQSRETWIEAALLAEGAADSRAGEFRGRLTLVPPSGQS